MLHRGALLLHLPRGLEAEENGRVGEHVVVAVEGGKLDGHAHLGEIHRSHRMLEHSIFTNTAVEPQVELHVAQSNFNCGSDLRVTYTVLTRCVAPFVKRAS